MVLESMIGLLLAASAAPGEPQTPESVVFLLKIAETPIGRSALTTCQDPPGMFTRRESSRMVIRRGTEEIEILEEGTWTEDSTGSLYSVEMVRSGWGPGSWKDRLERVPGGLRRERTRGSSSSVDTLDSGPLIGPVGEEAVFASGAESLRIRTVDPAVMAPATYRATLLRGDTLREGLKAVPCRLYAVRDSAAETDRGPSLQWRDLAGRLWREEDEDLGFTVERIEGSDESGLNPEFDALAWRPIPLDGTPPASPPCALFMRPIEGHDPSSESRSEPPVLEDASQRVGRGLQAGSWVVRTVAREIPMTAEASRIAWQRDLALAPALQSDLIVDAADPAIRAFATRALAGHQGPPAGGLADSRGASASPQGEDSALTPTDEALILERAVHDRISIRDMGTVVATASQTLKDGRGDCTEHAVLLAACCRARGIPARLVAGLVPVGDRMLFHLWTEVYLDDWFPLDATLGQGRAHPCAVALLRWTQLEEQADAFMLPFERIAGRFRFRVEGASE